MLNTHIATMNVDLDRNVDHQHVSNNDIARTLRQSSKFGES